MINWLRRIFRCVMTPAVPANVNPNLPPAEPPPIVEAKPHAAPFEPDLEFVGTRDLYAAVASRYDGCLLITVRHGAQGDGSCSVVFLANGIHDVTHFLGSAAALTTQTNIREIQEDDL